jgi:hypothetical protein
MKTLRYLPLALSVALFTSCGMNSNLVNQFTVYGNNSQVVLDQANYRVVGTVSGSASDSYFLGFGGFKSNLVERAKRDMYQKAELDGKARAVINMSVERHRANYLLARKLTMTVTGTVVEFEK